MGKPMRALGLMSGTSMDGIDVAMIETDGEDIVHRGAAMTFPYPPEMRRQIAEAMAHARGLTERRQRPGMLAVAERAVTEFHASAVSAFLRRQGVPRGSIDVIGFHGQTVLHRPESRLTVQLGDGRLLAELSQRPVVYDMRAADVAAGGQGAPLVPVYHRALLFSLPQRPVAVLNLGGVANVTFIGGDGGMIAFDTGPGNAMIDDFMRARAGAERDEDGAFAARGQVNEDVVRFYASHEFFALRPPKSLDRNAFPSDPVDWMSIEDGAATLTAFAAEAVARAVPHLPQPPRLWVACGGGRRNATLMGMIAERVGVEVVAAEAVGLDGDSVEAEAWGYLAVRSLKGLPLTFPGTTGVAQPMSGGLLAGPPLAA